MKKRCKLRKFLMEEQALAIFKIKILNDASHHMKRITAEEVSVKYGVSVKAIKNIWNRRSWSNETSQLNTEALTTALSLLNQVLCAASGQVEFAAIYDLNLLPTEIQ